MNPSLSAVGATRAHLVRQLVYFDEQGSQFHDAYLFSYPEAERHALERMIRTYIDTLTALLEHDDDELGKRLQSIVLVGSKVNVRYEDDGFEEAFTIVFPTESDPDKNRISFLSPIGRQLLCASPDRTLSLNVPDGKMDVAVLNVSYAYIGGFAAE